MDPIQYLLSSSICLSIAFIFYKLIFRNETNFRQLRFYILASLLVSIALPLSSYKLNIGIIPKEREIKILETRFQPTELKSVAPENDRLARKIKVSVTESRKTNWLLLVKTTYAVISAILILNLLFQISQIIFYYFKSEKTKRGKYKILANHHFKNSFSFFNWIFINKESCSKEDQEKIITHEMIHASQYHSIDLIIIEMLTAIMWFNPFIWMIKNTMQLIHEYLADEGTLKTGIDKFRYQALLINQISGENLISLSSSFNHSQIKKRMIMMSKNNLNRKSKFSNLTLVPITAILFVIVSFINGLFPDSIKGNPLNINTVTEINDHRILQNNSLTFFEDTVKKTKIRKTKGRNNKDEMVLKENNTTSNIKDTSKLIQIADGIKSDNPNRNEAYSIEPMNLFKQYNFSVSKTKNFSSQIMEYKFKNTSKPYIYDNLILIDGVKTNLGINQIDPTTIQSINVINNPSLIKIYSDKPYSGLILISTKKIELNKETQK